MSQSRLRHDMDYRRLGGLVTSFWFNECAAMPTHAFAPDLTKLITRTSAPPVPVATVDDSKAGLAKTRRQQFARLPHNRKNMRW